MVIIWNDLACGDREAAAVLVAINSVFQVVAFAVLGWFYLSVLPGWLGLAPDRHRRLDGWDIARSVLIFLGIPLVAGFLSRRARREGPRPRLVRAAVPAPHRPWALYGLLFTIVVLFALQGEAITSRPLDVARIALPLLVYFAVMWGGGFAPRRRLRLSATSAPRRWPSPRRATTSSWPSPSPSPPSASTSGQALAGVVGPLIEVPVLVALVYVVSGCVGATAPPRAAGWGRDRRCP